MTLILAVNDLLNPTIYNSQNEEQAWLKYTKKVAGATRST